MVNVSPNDPSWRIYFRPYSDTLMTKILILYYPKALGLAMFLRFISPTPFLTNQSINKILCAIHNKTISHRNRMISMHSKISSFPLWASTICRISHLCWLASTHHPVFPEVFSECFQFGLQYKNNLWCVFDWRKSIRVAGTRGLWPTQSCENIQNLSGNSVKNIKVRASWDMHLNITANHPKGNPKD